MKFSVIIPAYRAENYISDCILSVCNQDYPKDDFEVIVIDDCSPDNQNCIIEELCKENKNLQLLKHTLNKRQGGARNTGLKAASGEWVFFLDADDCWLSDKVFSIFASLIDTYPDAGIIESSTHKDIKQDFTLSQLQSVESEINPIMFERNEFLASDYPPYTVMGCYKREMLLTNDVFFRENCFFEDAEYRTKTIYYAKQLITIDFPFYGYRNNPSSTCRKNNIKVLLDNIDGNVEILQFVDSKIDISPEARIARNQRALKNVFSFLKITRGYPFREKRICYKHLNASILMDASRYRMGVADKLKFYLMKCCPALAFISYNLAVKTIFLIKNMKIK